jgi:Zn finger protein HypA/HybF involved in hydrogenase expression
MMILYICKICGYFRDMTQVAFMAGVTTEKPQYNHTVTHCPNGHGEMYQVQKGDRLHVLSEREEEEKNEQ